MKKKLCAILALALLMLCGIALAEECKYAGQGGPCEIKWWVDTENRQHCRACFYHVEDKEDMNSHVPVTEWTDCTLDDGGECTGCGWDYVKEPDADNSEMYWLEFYYMLSAEMGTAPVQATVSGNELEIEMSADFFTTLDAMGVSYTETMMVDTTYTLTLPDGSEYAYEGENVTPEVKVERSGYGPGAWMEKMGLLTIGSPVYTNNAAPGTATVSVNVAVKNGKTYTLARTFTITGDAGAERLPGDADGNKGVSVTDAIALLRYLAGEKVSINLSNANVNGDGQVDVKDVLRILQYDAGWDVTLE